MWIIAYFAGMFLIVAAATGSHLEGLRGRRMYWTDLAAGFGFAASFLAGTLYQ